jgi:hypothetical protein
LSLGQVVGGGQPVTLGSHIEEQRNAKQASKDGTKDTNHGKSNIRYTHRSEAEVEQNITYNKYSQALYIMENGKWKIENGKWKMENEPTPTQLNRQ